MPNFVKVYGSILQSSVWLESPTTKVVWITMLALADQDGIVRASVPGLAHSANVRLADCERALATLAAPDHASRTKTDDGKRIEALDGGWLVINYKKYRELRTEDQIAAAVRQKRKRDRDRDKSRDSALHPTEVEVDKGTTNAKRGEYSPQFEALWLEYPKRAGANKAQCYRLVTGHLNAGITFDIIASGTKRYKKYIVAKGWVGTEFIKTPQVFYGRDRHFLSDWEVPKAPNGLVPMDRDAFLRSQGF